MAEISGVQGAVFAGGVALEASEWTWDGDQAVIDRSSFLTLGEPLNAAGQRTGAITMTGPQSTTTALAARGVVRGAVVTFLLKVNAVITISVAGRVSKVSYRQNKDQGPTWTVNAAQYGAAILLGV